MGELLLTSDIFVRKTKRNNLIYKCPNGTYDVLNLVYTRRKLQTCKPNRTAGNGLVWFCLLLHITITLTFIGENLFKSTVRGAAGREREREAFSSRYGLPSTLPEHSACVISFCLISRTSDGFPQGLHNVAHLNTRNI